MKLRDVGLCFLGGTVLYVSMAACAGGSSGTSGGVSRTTSGGGNGVTTVRDGTGGTHGTAGGTVSGGHGGSIMNPVPPAQADPGSRLKPKYRAGEDGSKEFIANQWWDSQRSEDCSFQLAADGQTRCLPSGADFRYFSDAQCSQPMVLMQGSCSAPKYATSATAAACGLDPSATHVFQLGAATNPTQIYAQAGGSCYAVGQAASDWQYFTVGAEIPANSFVAASVTHD